MTIKKKTKKRNKPNVSIRGISSTMKELLFLLEPYVRELPLISNIPSAYNEYSKWTIFSKLVPGKENSLVQADEEIKPGFLPQYYPLSSKLYILFCCLFQKSYSSKNRTKKWSHIKNCIPAFFIVFSNLSSSPSLCSPLLTLAPLISHPNPQLIFLSFLNPKISPILIPLQGMTGFICSQDMEGQYIFNILCSVLQDMKECEHASIYGKEWPSHLTRRNEEIKI